MGRFADQEMVQILRSEDGAKGHLSPTEMYNQGANKCHRNTGNSFSLERPVSFSLLKPRLCLISVIEIPVMVFLWKSVKVFWSSAVKEMVLCSDHSYRANRVRPMLWQVSWNLDSRFYSKMMKVLSHDFSDGPRKRCESGMSNEMDKCNQIHEQNDGCNKEQQNEAEKTNRRHTDVILEISCGFCN